MESPLLAVAWITREVSCRDGGLPALRRTVWDELGGFDPRFPVNYKTMSIFVCGPRSCKAIKL